MYYEYNNIKLEQQYNRSVYIPQQEDFTQFARNFRATIKNVTNLLIICCAEVPSKLRETSCRDRSALIRYVIGIQN